MFIKIRPDSVSRKGSESGENVIKVKRIRFPDQVEP